MGNQMQMGGMGMGGMGMGMGGMGFNGGFGGFWIIHDLMISPIIKNYFDFLDYHFLFFWASLVTYLALVLVPAV